MSLRQKLSKELRSVGAAAVYFGVWIGMLVTLKKLILAEYDIEFSGLSKALIAALVVSKVVLVLEHVPLGRWVGTRPALVDVVLRTGLYGVGLLVVLLLEKAFEGRHEAGGFGPSLLSVFEHEDIHHVLVNAVCLSGALLVFNASSIVRQRLGAGEVRRLFLSPISEEAANAEKPPG